MPASMHRMVRHIGAVMACAALALLPMTMPTPRALAESDVLQQAINYIFTGRIDPQDAPTITDRASCVVLVADPRNKRSIRYYLGRFKLDPPQFETTYSGRTPNYTLAVEGDDDVVEFLNPDMSVAHGHRTVRIALAGDLDESQRALRLISEQCKPRKPKTLFQ